MSIATAAAALRDADEALAAAKVIRDGAFEALIGAAVEAGWRVIFRLDERVVLEQLNGGTAELQDLAAATQGAAA